MRHFLDHLRRAWVGWMQGIALDMVVTFLLLYIGLSLVGLDFVVFFAVLSALLVVVPYFGAIAGGIPPTLFALTDSPGKAAVVLLVYVLSQQIEGNLTIPLVMSRTVRLHPAVIAIGVIVVAAVRLHRAVRRRADPVAARDRHRGVLGPAARGGRARAAPWRARAASGGQARGGAARRRAGDRGRASAAAQSFVIAMIAPIKTNSTISA
jgi:AI-2E family transporter